MAKSSKTSPPLKIYFVMGEQSGENLAIDLLDAFDEMGVAIEPLGLGGEKLQQRGLNSLFDVTDLSVIGISGVIGKLPTIIQRVKQTVKTKTDIFKHFFARLPANNIAFFTQQLGSDFMRTDHGNIFRLKNFDNPRQQTIIAESHQGKNFWK